MSGDAIDLLLDAIDAAESEALAQHRAGTCHLSEWSCSYCEADVSAASGKMAR